MTRAIDIYISTLEAYVLGLKYSQERFERYKLLLHILEKLYGTEVRLIRNNVCPWCGTRFNRRGIITHLMNPRSRKPCHEHFYMMLTHVAWKFYQVSSYLRNMRHQTVLYLKVDGKIVKIKGRTKLREALLTNDEILKAFLNMVDPTEEILVLS